MTIFARSPTYLFWLPLTLLLAASTLNTKAPGFAWLGFILAGLLAWWQSRQMAKARPAEVSASPLPVYAGIARIWLITTATALLLKTVPMLYWADPWGERHAEFRLLLGALGLYGLCQLPLERLRRAYLDANYAAWVGSGLAVACALALWLVLVKGSDAAPTNRIPWACALAISTCTLLTLARVVTDWRLRYFWLAASVAGLLAVLASDVRGAYGLVLVWPARQLQGLAPPVAAAAAGVADPFRWRWFGYALAGYGMFGVGYIGYMTFVIALLREQGAGATAITVFYSLLSLLDSPSVLHSAPRFLLSSHDVDYSVRP